MSWALRRADTLHVGTLKGVGWVYRQTFVATYAKAGFAKVHDCKTPIMAADLRNGLVLPLHPENGAVPQRVLTGRGAEQRGTHGRHECKLFLAAKSIDPPAGNHSIKLRLAKPLAGFARAKAGSPQITGFVERYRKTMLNAFHRNAFRKNNRATIGGRISMSGRRASNPGSEVPPGRESEPCAGGRNRA